MSSRRLAFLLALTLPLLALGLWRHRVSARRAAEAALFFNYVDGPLNDYALAVTRLNLDIPEAAKASARSAGALKALLQGASEGGIKARLEALLPLHERAAALIAAKAGWNAEQKSILAKIIYALEDVRYRDAKNWKMPLDRFLELNALIFSLKEALTSTM